MTRDVRTSGSRGGTGRLITLFLLSWAATSAATDLSPLKKIIAASDQRHRCETAAIVSTDDISPETIPGQESPARVSEDDETQPMEIPADGLVVIETAAVEPTPGAAVGTSTPATAPANENPKTKRKRGKKKRLAKLAAAAAAAAAKAPPPSPVTAPAVSEPAAETPKVYDTPSGLPPPPIAPPSGPRRPLLLIPRPEAIAAPVAEQAGPPLLARALEEAGPYAAARPPAFTARVWNALVKQVSQRFGDSKAQVEERLLIGKLGHLLRAACSPAQAPVTPVGAQDPKPSFTLTWKWDRLIIKDRNSLVELWIENGKLVAELPLIQNKKVTKLVHHISRKEFELPGEMRKAIESKTAISAATARLYLHNFFHQELHRGLLKHFEAQMNAAFTQQLADLQAYGLFPTEDINAGDFLAKGAHLHGQLRLDKEALAQNCLVSFGARAGQIWMRAQCPGHRERWLRFPLLRAIRADGSNEGALKQTFLRSRALAEWTAATGDEVLSDNSAGALLGIYANADKDEFATAQPDILFDEGIFAGSSFDFEKLKDKGLKLRHVGYNLNQKGEPTIEIELGSSKKFKPASFDMPADIAQLNIKVEISESLLQIEVLSFNYQTNKGLLLPEQYVETASDADGPLPPMLSADISTLIMGRIQAMTKWNKKSLIEYLIPMDGAGNSEDWWFDIDRLEKNEGAESP